MMNMAAVYPPSTAPPEANMFNNVPGYEGTVAGGGGFLPPPMPLEPVAPPQPGPVPDHWNIPSLSEDVAREAFKSFASSHCCYNKSPANEGVITSMEPHDTFRYRLETFTESRSTEWSQKPYEGEPADFYTQTAPQPWEVPVTPPKHFKNHEEKIRVPYTSSIKDCNTCHSSGTIQCEECHGDRFKTCSLCNGSGENCTSCKSTGQESCSKCDGHGTEKCETCNGKRQLLTFIELTLKWKNNVDDSVVEQSSGLPDDDLKSVSGKELYKNEQLLLYPLVGFPNPAIGEASDRLIKEHWNKYRPTFRILQQRQTVELIPITKVNYKWKGDSHLFFVYGNENKVSAENYPATCCCVVQ